MSALIIPLGHVNFHGTSAFYVNRIEPFKLELGLSPNAPDFTLQGKNRVTSPDGTHIDP
jgi:hypothetical protein